jgi:hypothetical protein
MNEPMEVHIVVRECYVTCSVSNGSGLPCVSPGRNWNGDPGPGYEPPMNLTRWFMAGLIPGPDIETWVFGRVGTRPLFQLYCSYTFASN